MVYIVYTVSIKSVYIAKLRQRYCRTLKNILLHVSNHALKYKYMLSYGTIKKQLVL